MSGATSMVCRVAAVGQVSTVSVKPGLFGGCIMIEDDETIDVFNGVEFGMTDHPAVALSSAGKRRPWRFPASGRDQAPN